MHADVDAKAFTPRPIDELRDDAARSPLARAFRVQVIHDHGHAGAPGDVDRLDNRIDVGELLRVDVGRRFLRGARELPFGVLALTPQMRLIVAAVGRHHFCQLDDFFLGTPATRHILEPRRQTERAFFHPLPHELLHLVDFSGGRRAHVVAAHHQAADRPMADHRHEIQRTSRFFEVFALLRQGPPRSAVRVDNRRREPLRGEVRQRATAVDDVAFDVLVKRDEPWRDVLIARIDRARSARVRQAADRGDGVAADADVGVDERIAGAIEHAAVPDDDVVGGCLRRGGRAEGRKREEYDRDDRVTAFHCHWRSSKMQPRRLEDTKKTIKDLLRGFVTSWLPFTDHADRVQYPLSKSTRCWSISPRSRRR